MYTIHTYLCIHTHTCKRMFLSLLFVCIYTNKNISVYVHIVQSLRRVWLFVTPWTAACQACLSFTISQSLLKLIFIELVMLSNYLILCHPLLFLSSIFPNIRAFSSESTLCIRWPNYQSFSVSMSLLNEYSGLISFRIDWFGLFVVQGSLKSSPVP